MKLAEIRRKIAWDEQPKATTKQATRDWARGLQNELCVAVTLTLKQSWEVKTDKGVFIQRINRQECVRVARHFKRKLEHEIFGNAARRYNKRLKWLTVLEGERTNKNLHLHIATNMPKHIKWNEIDGLVTKAKCYVKELDTQHKVDITDSGWVDYITKEVGAKDTDNVLWEVE
jgi:hypothetical protein